MQKLTDSDYKLMRTLLKLNQESMRKTLSKYLKEKYSKVIITKDYIIAEGDIPIGLVAHMDTVFPSPPDDVYFDKEQNIMWSPQGAGFDDRAGIFAILKILQSGLKPTVIFTTDEEKGCLGASAMVTNIPECPWELNYLIQLDRRGTNDCVFYDCDNEEFNTYVESFGFLTAIGSFSDIAVICPDWEIAGVNLSVGYFNEHTTSEILNPSALLRVIDLVKKMLLDTEHFKKYEFIPTKFSYSPYSWNYFPLDDDKDDDDDLFLSETSITCKICNKEVSMFDYLPIVNTEGKLINVCVDCCGTEVEWCDGCGHGFIPTPGESNQMFNHYLCVNCRKTMKDEMR